MAPLICVEGQNLYQKGWGQVDSGVPFHCSAYQWVVLACRCPVSGFCETCWSAIGQGSLGVTRASLSPSLFADLHWLHHRLGEPLPAHRWPVRAHHHGAVQQAPPGRAPSAHLRHRQRVLPLPVEAPRQPVRPHQVTREASAGRQGARGRRCAEARALVQEEEGGGASPGSAQLTPALEPEKGFSHGLISQMELSVLSSLRTTVFRKHALRKRRKANFENLERKMNRVIGLFA